MAFDDGLAKTTPENTAAAVLVAIVTVLPAAIPAAVAVLLYTFVFNLFTGGSSWIPYLHEIGLMWFPEILRGIVIGSIAMWTSRYFFPRSSVEAVRLATLAFWGALLIALLLFSVTFRGLTLDIVGVLALLVGLAVGLWTNDR
ncbi:hypothetical protein [Aminobacter ciceronei]|uniref:Transmembrane protein n=1 Tax=Aminobacter ciceronei TaxID=150723 RepID=A0ABR6CIB2_9HYPH|nr:hypothetical protein [Aminobacter ciceronei]MBA8910691.1 hypothetical protein [Aminobacter ciceronei]MBA9024471.1 hypothetical protein [Aminobacter ciceronei]